MILVFYCHRFYFERNVLFNRIINSGGYDKEEKAARAYDLAALKYWGPSTTTNFPVRHLQIFMNISMFLILTMVNNIVVCF